MEDFKFVSSSHSGLTVQHVTQGHYFNFYIVDESGPKYLSLATIREGEGSHSGSELAHDAIAFATVEAKRLGLI